MNKNIKMTPEDQLLKAIWGDKYKTAAEEEAEIEEFARKVDAMTDEEFEAEFGYTREEEKARTAKMMIFAGWCDTLARWKREHGNDRKYVVSDAKPEFTFRQVCDMATLFYNWGREDQSNGVSEYDRLWALNRENEKKDGE